MISESTPLLSPQPFGRYGWAIGLACLGTGLLLLPWSFEIHKDLRSSLASLPLNDFWNTARQFAATTGLLIIFGAIALLEPHPSRRRWILGCLVAALLAGAAVNEPIKRITGRMRPEFSVSLDPPSQRGFERRRLERFSQHDLQADGSPQWLITRGINRPWFFDAYASFPSGHSCAAAVLAVILSAAYARGRLLWLILGIGCALSRVRHDRHFIDDCLVGFAIGWLMGHLVLALLRKRLIKASPPISTSPDLSEPFSQS